ncbi:MAG: KH domain-containing protein [Clostridia bacterium]|nr:KH domain-containing protein [Clostridia bacterium]
MKDVLLTIIESLVEDKSAIEINQVDSEKNIVFEVRVAHQDMGRVIGKEGRIAKAIRTIFKAVAAKEQKKVTIEFID